MKTLHDMFYIDTVSIRVQGDKAEIIYQIIRPDMMNEDKSKSEVIHLTEEVSSQEGEMLLDRLYELGFISEEDEWDLLDYSDNVPDRYGYFLPQVASEARALMPNYFPIDAEFTKDEQETSLGLERAFERLEKDGLL